MIKLKQAVIVEGKYDKIKLSSIIDAPIITTEGFGIFKDKQKREYIKKLAKKRGIIILTDSDSGGFVIRNHITSFVPKNEIINAYIPDVFGKEKRKLKAGKEGKIGVEGIDEDTIIEALNKAGVIAQEKQGEAKQIKKSDLYELNLYGTDESSAKRKRLQKELELPERMSVNALLEALNIFLSYDELIELNNKLFSEELIG